ncbi:NAD(P)-binding domain-containing protein [Galbitalea sp. SE-J8]|uniref:NADPH-dependent F420 reductase n=1 Tax=Galbitalea sp. SE-J8 TaxID=3054952 RepID=UPI00259CB311|nr:NAD(P)-binding domain-containing protein [Galbitalea sp. SE-J8]MDM4763834.1 NAD(P)-binding domain-containing protein [Galbitalea sp. SE-J8]
MRITILGTGTVATTLAGGLIAAGHDVVFGSRTPDEPRELPAPVRDRIAAIDGADLVVSALAASASLETLSEPALAEALAGHVLLDLGNAYRPPFELVYPNSSLGEKLQAALPRTRVVKALNTLGLAATVNPEALPAPTTQFLSGDDAAAKALVSGLLVDLGWPVEQQIDLGGIIGARGQEHYFLLFVALMPVLATPYMNIAVVRSAG